MQCWGLLKLDVIFLGVAEVERSPSGNPRESHAQTIPRYIDKSALLPIQLSSEIGFVHSAAGLRMIHRLERGLWYDTGTQPS